MRESAKLLEQYSKLFEETQQKVNIQKEFTDCMMSEAKVPQTEITDYVTMKLKGMMAAELGNQFRQGSA